MRQVLRASAVTLVVALVMGCATTATQPPDDLKYTTSKTGLKYAEVKVGTGDEAKAGDVVEVHYTGKLTTGKQFDSSIGDKPIKFTLGKGQVIPGWDEGIAGIKVGGKRKLVIPPDLAYGKRGAGADIPPNATLLFDVELVSVKR